MVHGPQGAGLRAQCSVRSVRPLGVIYEVIGGELYVLRVLHGRRLRDLP